MQCQQCGVELEPNSNLCDQCGRSVPEPQTGRISFEGVTNRPTINQNTINVGGMTPHEFSTITGMLALRCWRTKASLAVCLPMLTLLLCQRRPERW